MTRTRQALGLDEFMSHQPSGGGRTNYLRGWKKNRPPEVDVWLHTRAGFFALWQHNIPLVQSWDDKQSNVHRSAIWGKSFNCFSGATRFWANGQLLRLDAAVGEIVKVIAGDGEWRDAEVKCFGEQPLRRIVLGMPGSQFELVYRATADHRWITSNRGEVTDLKPGDRVIVSPKMHHAGSPEFTDGFAHGFVFGDGYRTARPDVFQARLCGAKANLLEELKGCSGFLTVSRPPSWGGDPSVRIRSKRDLKRLPSDEESFTYQAGFLAGWMAADARKAGSHGSPSRELHSIDSAALDWVAERAPLLGFSVTGRGGYANQETNFGARSAPLRYVALRPEPVEYAVREVADEGAVEPVYCVVEPATHAFTLEGGVVTGNCWENEDVLGQQYFTDRDTDERVAPPEVCPVCKLREHVRQLVRDGALTIVDPVFNFDAGDSEDAQDERYRTVTAGGILNAFRADKMSDEEKRLVKEARIKVGGDGGAWRDNMAAKCNYLFAVVDNSHPESGVQIAIEGTSLGNAMKTAIAKEIKRLVANRRPKEEGNPLLYPYAFRWMYDANEKNPGKQYDAMALDIELDDEIRRLIVDEEAPDLERLTKPGDVRMLRGQWEVAAAIELPFDEIFAAAEAEQASDPEADDSFDYGANAQGEEAPAAPAAPAKPAERPPARQAPAKAQAQGRVPEVGRQPARAAAATAGRQASPPAGAQGKPAARAPARPGAAQAPAGAKAAEGAAQSAKPAPRQPAKPAAGTKPAPSPAKPAPSPAKPAARAPAGRQPAKPAPKPEPPPADAIPCDNPECRHPMAPDELVCPKCGAEYDDVPEAAAEGAVESAAEPGPDAPDADEWSPEDGNVTGGDGDDIPWS